MALRTMRSGVRAAAWLGWQIESNWADTLTFVVYSVLRPLGTALILAGMYWAVAGRGAGGAVFAAFYVANAFHEYLVRVLIGMGWAVVEEREEYEMLRYIYTSPMGLRTYLTGRSAMKFLLASVSVLLILTTGWFLLGVRWDWSAVRWLPLLLAFGLGLVATIFVGYLLAGWTLVLPRAAVNINEGAGVAFYLLCGVIFPIDLMPRVMQWIALALPFTYWYEALRRFLLGHGASAMLSRWSDAQLLSALALGTAAIVVVSTWGFHALERKARREGKLDMTTWF